LRGEKGGLVVNTSTEFIQSHKAARLLGVAPRTIRERILRGEIELYIDPLDARRRLIRTADLEALKVIRPARNTQTTERSVA